MYIRTYVATYIRTYVHRYIRTEIKTYIRTYVHTYIRTYTRTYIRTRVHTYTRAYVSECAPLGSREPPSAHGRTGVRDYDKWQLAKPPRRCWGACKLGVTRRQLDPVLFSHSCHRRLPNQHELQRPRDDLELTATPVLGWCDAAAKYCWLLYI